MKKGIEKSKPGVVTEKALPWMRPFMPGMVNHPVYSTWALVRAMECASRKVLFPYLEMDKGEDAVGCEVFIRHLAPAPLGKTVRVIAKFKEKKGPIVVCELEAFCGNVKIGEGTHKQFVLSTKKHKKFLKAAKQLT